MDGLGKRKILRRERSHILVEIEMENNHFAYSWRFDDERYNLLLEEDLLLISPISPTKSKEIWASIFKDGISHLIELSPKSGWTSIKKEQVDTDIYDSGISFISNYGYDDKDIVFFWNNENAVSTKWSIFKKYWNDFCYPSDDNNLIYIDACNIITFTDEIFCFYSRIEG